jgi:very-short-patch-repair endonuclease
MTQAERRLWYHLRAHRFEGFKFKRQIPIAAYVVDFACLSCSLIVEIDGGQHSAASSDRVRDEILKAKGFRILRFWNNDVLRNTDAVLGEILLALEQAAPLSRRAARATLSPEGRGEI